jgi:hypothetical protein
LVRVRRGNASMRAALAAGPAPMRARGAARTSWLRDVALRNPSLIPSAAFYAAITVTAAMLARLPERTVGAWGRDNSTRQDDSRTGDFEAANGRG